MRGVGGVKSAAKRIVGRDGVKGTQLTWKEKRDAREAAARAKREAEQARQRAETKRKDEERRKKQPGKVAKAAGAILAAADKLYWDKKKWGF